VFLQFVLSSVSPSLFVEHCIHANELNDWLHACPHTECKQTKKIGVVLKSMSTKNVVVGVPIESP
jgi:hypothetical protein